MKPHRPVFSRNCSICFWRRRQRRQIAPPAPADSATSAAFSMLPSAAPAPASDPAHLIGAEVIRLDEKSLSIRDLPELPTSELSGFTVAESAATHRPLPARRYTSEMESRSVLAVCRSCPPANCPLLRLPNPSLSRRHLAEPVIETSQDAARIREVASDWRYDNLPMPLTLRR